MKITQGAVLKAIIGDRAGVKRMYAGESLDKTDA